MKTIVNKRWREGAPETLYHYTSLSSLALILKNRALRLSPLSNLDDPQESKSRDLIGAALSRYIFVSCWTDDKTESIPMWNMYAGLEDGVRIEMPIDPFKRYSYNAHDMSLISGIPESNISFECDMRTFLPAEDMRRCCSHAFMTGEGILQKVTYTSDKSLLEPEIFIEEENTIAIGALGIHKNEHWCFQREWRYVLPFIPLDMLGPVDTAEMRFATALRQAMDPNSPPTMDYYDIYLSDEAIQDIRIIPSPKMSAGNIILLDALLAQHGLSNRLEHSELEGLL